MSIKSPLITLLLSTNLHAWEPGISQPEASTMLAVDTQNRADVLSFYHCIYAASENQASSIAWTGNAENCQAGATSPAFKDHVLRRINWYRAMAGVPADITFTDSQNIICQEAALMMSQNQSVDTTPPSSWDCYTPGGATAAGISNLALASYGVEAIDRYLESPGNDTAAGNRRWILAPRVQTMGSGDIPSSSQAPGANCLKVIGDFRSPSVPDQASAWPPQGYVPWQSIFERWSYSFTGADFSAATVSMTHNGQPIPITIDSRTLNFAGDNSIIWKAPSALGPVTADQTYTVTISGIQNATSNKISYDVTIIDPTTLADDITITGPTLAPPRGNSYSFNQIDGATAYQLSVSKRSPNTTSEGAENTTSAQLIDGTPDQSARISSSPRSGDKCFQLAPLDFSASEFFELDRNFITHADSSLQFHFLEGLATSTTELRCQISQDGGASWISLWKKTGQESRASTYQEITLPLSAFPEQSIRIRFEVAHLGGSIFGGDSENSGYRIDDISLFNSSIEEGETLTNITLAQAQAGTLTLNTTTAGSPLAIGQSYRLKVRPLTPHRAFAYSRSLEVAITEGCSLNEWLLTQPGSITPIGGIEADPDQDGLSNGLEFILGSDPQQPNSHSLLPPLILDPTTGTTTLTIPNTATLTGVAIQVLSSPDLKTWTPIPASYQGLDQLHTTPITDRAFFQIIVTETK